MTKREDNIVDLMLLVESELHPNSLLESLMLCDIILLESWERVEKGTFDTYKSLLEQLGEVLGPYFNSVGDNVGPNLFSSDLSRMKLEQLEAFSSKRASMYGPELISKVEKILEKVPQLD